MWTKNMNPCHRWMQLHNAEWDAKDPRGVEQSSLKQDASHLDGQRCTGQTYTKHIAGCAAQAKLGANKGHRAAIGELQLCLVAVRGSSMSVMPESRYELYRKNETRGATI